MMRSIPPRLRAPLMMLVFGAVFAGKLSNLVLRRAFGGIMLLVSLRFLIFSK